jgi:hypothetical protein
MMMGLAGHGSLGLVVLTALLFAAAPLRSAGASPPRVIVPEPPKAPELNEKMKRRAKAAYRVSARLFERGDFEGSLDAANDMHRLRPNASTALYRADVLERLGRHCASFEALLEALELRPDSGEREDARKALGRAGRACEPNMGWARVAVKPRRAKLRVSGIEAPAGHTLGLSVGRHSVVAEAKGFRSLRAQIVVLAGQASVVSFELERAPEAKVAAPVPLPPKMQRAPAVEQPVAPVADVEAESTGGPGPLQWALAGSGAALLGGGVGMHLWSFSAAKDGEKYQSPIDGMTRDERKEMYDEASDRAQTRQIVAYVLYGAGAAALVTAIILWDSGEASEESAFYVLPSLAPDAVGISLQGGLW